MTLAYVVIPSRWHADTGSWSCRTCTESAKLETSTLEAHRDAEAHYRTCHPALYQMHYRRKGGFTGQDDMGWHAWDEESRARMRRQDEPERRPDEYGTDAMF